MSDCPLLGNFPEPRRAKQGMQCSNNPRFPGDAPELDRPLDTESFDMNSRLG